MTRCLVGKPRTRRGSLVSTACVFTFLHCPSLTCPPLVCGSHCAFGGQSARGLSLMDATKRLPSLEAVSAGSRFLERSSRWRMVCGGTYGPRSLRAPSS
jgi:hypothetical protein